jgi:beta-lactamase regulating signal transducer with metallopeptidase domain
MSLLDALGAGVLLAWVLLPVLLPFASRTDRTPASRRRALTIALLCSAAALAIPALAGWAGSLAVLHQIGQQAPAAARTTVVFAGDLLSGRGNLAPPLLRWLGGAWLALVGLGTVRLLHASWRLRLWSARSRPLVSLRHGAEALCMELGLDPAAVRSDAAVPMPLAWGWWRPLILVPENLARMLDEQQLSWVLRHEAEHIRRGHNRLALLVAAVSPLFFAHPALALLLARLDLAREEEVDAAIAGADPKSYARTLIRVAEARIAVTGGPLPAAGAGGSLRERITALTSEERPTRPVSAAPATVALALLLASALAWSACGGPTTATRPDPAPPPSSTARTEEDVAMGALPKEAIQSVISEHKEEVRRCYEQALNSGRPDLAGKLAVHWIIAADGRVESAEALPASTLDDPTTVACILEAVRTWRFPEPLDGGVVEINYPFTFAVATPQP